MFTLTLHTNSAQAPYLPSLPQFTGSKEIIVLPDCKRPNPKSKVLLITALARRSSYLLETASHYRRLEPGNWKLEEVIALFRERRNSSSATAASKLIPASIDRAIFGVISSQDFVILKSGLPFLDSRFENREKKNRKRNLKPVQSVSSKCYRPRQPPRPILRTRRFLSSSLPLPSPSSLCRRLRRLLSPRPLAAPATRCFIH